jgi:hypothetical protein
MQDKVFAITGNKISSFIADEDSLKFSNQKFNTVPEFRDAWNKKLSLATKLEVKYESIKSVRKEDNDQNIIIKYKTWAGITGDCEFSFLNSIDYEIFFNFLEKDRFFTRTHGTLTPFKATRNYLIGLLATIGFTIFIYYQALDIANGTVEEASSGKVRTFNYLIGLLGDKGVIAVGALITCFLLYKIWTRFSNPPGLTRFSPLNA